MKIAISGFSGSGKTSLAKELSIATGFDLIIPSFKELAKKKGISLMEFQELASKNPNIDKEFDEFIRNESSKKENCIVATWLAIWIVEADVRVFLHSPLEQRAKRIAKRDGISFEEALSLTKKRDEQNYERYKKIYNINIKDFLSQADIVLNTSSLTLKEEVEVVLSLVNKRIRKG